jgi:hypothetical protein
MSKLLENKQIIHIATEVVVLMGITFYFSSKNKKLFKHIEELSHKVEDLEDILQKHEQIIRQLVQTINSKQPTKPTINKSSPSPTQKNTSRSAPKHSTPKKVIYRSSADVVVEPTVKFHEKEENEENEEISSEDESDLDNEISEELEELQQDSLKKRT